MNKNIFEKNIIKMLNLYENEQKKLYKLINWIDHKWKQRDILDSFLENIKFLKNKENRVLAFSRIIELKETPLKLLIEKEKLEFNHAKEIIDKSYIFTKDFQEKMQENFLNEIKEKRLLTPFYFEILYWVHNVWKTFSNFYVSWNNYIINWINRGLDKQYKNDKEEVISFLNKNNLYDLWHNSKIWDRCYSALVRDNFNYKSKPYIKVFKKEIWEIIKALDLFIKKLSELEDNIYEQKEKYLNYLLSIKKAFLEKNKDKLIKMWAEVDYAWMEITSPFQITHPLEFYEDKYRKAVAPEWDLRIKSDFISNSSVLTDIIKMYEWFYKSIWKNNFIESYNFSLNNLQKIQLYISIPILYYGAHLCGLPSAQVVPNDEEVSKKFWKKIFAFPKYVLDFQRKTPFLKIQSMVIDKTILSKYRYNIFWDEKKYYKIYDIETLWHEFWHLLWLTPDTEVKMNKKTWVYKNIEEFKATTWWFISFFMSDDIHNLKQELIISHIVRCINLLKYKKEIWLVAYYCEALIHLDILLKSGIIYLKKDRLYMYFNDKNYNNLKDIYMEIYSKLMYIYLNKNDAWDFLFDFLANIKWYYESKNEELAYFSKYYYELYKEIWNEIDDTVKKENYTKKIKGFIQKITEKFL